MTAPAAPAPSSPTGPVLVDWPSPSREQDFDRWFVAIAPAHGLRRETLRIASADASARRYLRVDGRAGSWIVMDAPPPQNDVAPFVHIAGLIQAAGLHGPRVIEQDPALGFLLLDDLGDRPYLAALQAGPPATSDRLMRDAIEALVRWQLGIPADTLPPYDEAFLRRELQIFPEWCVQREFGRTWSEAEQATWERICGLLVDSALAQPTVAVHRDWMPRNLMVAEPNPGILDFQDALRGPITYDVASLLRDAFVSWDEAQELDWAVRYWQRAQPAGLPVDPDFGEFWRALEWMGLQRHLKVLGIFCRLKHRDGKPKYVEDLPRFFDYALKVAHRYGPLRPLIALLEPLSAAAGGQVRVQGGLTF
jgi:aminoglycoside/choline kinase family phosphotransferase